MPPDNNSHIIGTVDELLPVVMSLLSQGLNVELVVKYTDNGENMSISLHGDSPQDLNT